MENSKIDKALKNATEMLTVINAHTLKEGASESQRDASIIIWKKINDAMKNITDARVIIYEQLKK
jgi:hypothetical protein